MKALILAGGRGSRLEPLTEETAKCLLPLDGRPLLEYSLENAHRAGVESIILVVGHLAEQIINHCGNRYRDIPIRYVIQWEQQGLVHAIECARKELGESDFMLFLADEILIKPRHREMLEMFRAEDLLVVCGVIHVEDRSQISKTYSVILAESDRRIYRLIEKPEHPMNDIMGTGNCVFRNDILGYIPACPINQKRGEKELPDLIQCGIDAGKVVKAFHLGERYVNVNTPDDIRLAEQAM